ncbi:hypothetical protein ACIG5E_29190 [Kitasatospora sp. NPDC053057]|uniref:hypothetical protein n=1 Tax=Kitasatospora sp. NPDC053057 TaxID=3364062 RepID=UPI0037CB97B6
MIEITGVQAEPGGSATLRFEDGKLHVEPDEQRRKPRTKLHEWFLGIGFVAFLVMLLAFGLGRLAQKLHLPKAVGNAVTDVALACLGVFLLCLLLGWISVKLGEFFGTGGAGGGPKPWSLPAKWINGIEYQQIDPQGGLRATLRKSDNSLAHFTAPGETGPRLHRAFEQLLRPAAQQTSPQPVRQPAPQFQAQPPGYGQPAPQLQAQPPGYGQPAQYGRPNPYREG